MKKGFHHLTEKAEKRIVALRAAGKSHAEIARMLRCHRNSVYRTLKKFAMELPRRGPRIPVLTPKEQAEVLALLQEGKGTGRITKKLGLRQYLVRQFAEKHGFGRRRLWDAVPEDTREKIIAEIRGHQNPAVDIADKYSISYKVTLRIAHQVLHCPKFRPGSRGSGEPLSSNFPQKTFGPK
jgi:DNA-binding CsgD family transcriptional regulator